MSSSQGEVYGLARAALYGAVIATAWFALASLFIPRTFPVPVYYVPVMGATGGAVWHALGRAPFQGRLWYYCRWIVVSIVGGLWLIVGLASSEPGASLGILDVLATLGMFVLGGIGLARYTERLNDHEKRSQKQVLVRTIVKLLVIILGGVAIAWLRTR